MRSRHGCTVTCAPESDPALSGTAKKGTTGIYELVVTATNPMGTTEQTLVLHVTKP
jgi:hypothetical protein